MLRVQLSLLIDDETLGRESQAITLCKSEYDNARRSHSISRLIADARLLEPYYDHVMAQLKTAARFHDFFILTVEHETTLCRQ